MFHTQESERSIGKSRSFDFHSGTNYTGKALPCWVNDDVFLKGMHSSGKDAV